MALRCMMSLAASSAASEDAFISSDSTNVDPTPTKPPMPSPKATATTSVAELGRAASRMFWAATLPLLMAPAVAPRLDTSTPNDGRSMSSEARLYVTNPARISPKADATTLFAFRNGDGEEGGRGGGGSGGCFCPSEDTREDDRMGRYCREFLIPCEDTCDDETGRYVLRVCLGETNAPFAFSRPVPRRRTARSMAQGDADRQEHILCWIGVDGSAKPQPGLRRFRDMMLADGLRAPVEDAITCIVMGHRLLVHVPSL
mmetsp:Transcript_26550/g.62167  ORF Transcript_26550/g.62167 Transcript_26550/m.62167 type:complete len:258 (-) Transcript_26550:24-797(-)